MSLRQDTERYLRALDDAGYTVKRTGHMHLSVFDGSVFVAGSAAPSDYRGLLNLRAAIRRWERSKENAALARSPFTARRAGPAITGLGVPT